MAQRLPSTRQDASSLYIHSDVAKRGAALLSVDAAAIEAGTSASAQGPIAPIFSARVVEPDRSLRRVREFTNGFPSVDELIDVAIAAREVEQRIDPALAPGAGPVPPAHHMRVGVALLANSGRVFTGCSIYFPDGTAATSMGPAQPGGVMPAEQVALLKALSEGEKDFALLVSVASSETQFLQPSVATARLLATYGNFPVYLVRNDRTLLKKTLQELAGDSSAAATNVTSPDQSIDAEVGETVSHEAFFPTIPVARWSVKHVCAWLAQCCGLPQYQHRFREASVDGMRC
ncbi:MAG: hypothetical protein EOO65_02975 [Methanosarcinales archaeon]|nr:MAG: hypothetical protein EOO65_02975 [Methanosarcinales archaeon]